MEGWNVGRLEYWVKVGNKPLKLIKILPTHYSSFPLFQYSFRAEGPSLIPNILLILSDL